MKKTVKPHHRRKAACAVLICAGFGWSNARAAETLVPYRIVGDGIPAALTSMQGDPQRGKAVAVNSDRGNCLICHNMPIAEAPVFGDLGPPLAGIASRLSPAQMRLRIVDPKQLNAATLMPAFYKTEGLNRVATAYAGRPILSAQDVEDLMAYMGTLTAP